MALPWKRLRSCLSSRWKKNLRFSQRGFCILGLVFGSAMAEYSFLGFFIFFINKDNNRQDNMRYNAVVSNAKDSFSAFLASVLTYATHQRISPLIEILFTYLIFIMGMLILVLTPSPSDGIFYLAIVLLSVDKSGEAYVDEFAADRRAVDDATQVINDNKDNPNNRRDAWRFIGRSAGALIGSVVISRELSSKLVLIISAIVMGIGCIFFYSYCICYELTSEDHHHQEDKRDLRPLLKLLPLWAPFLFYYVVDAAGSTFFIEQGYAIGREASFLYMIQKFSELILLPSIGWIITKFWSEEIQQEQHARLAKITCGMFISFWICIDAWHVEACRLACDPDLSIHFMFVRLFVLLGIMKGMVEGMLGEYFRDHVPDQSMHHLESSFNSFVEGMGKLLGLGCIFVFKNWIRMTVYDSRLDNYYGVLAIMTLCALFVFVCLSKTCYRKKRTDDDNDVSMLEEGILHASVEIEGTNADNRDQSKPDSLFQSPESSVYYSADESSSFSRLDSAKSTSNSKWSILRRRRLQKLSLRALGVGYR